MEYRKIGTGKIEESSNGIVKGYYGSDSVDVDGHIIFKEDYISAFNEYLEWGNIRDNHGAPVGKVSLANQNDMPWNYFEVEIIDDNIIKLVNNGVYKGFSIGMRVDESEIISIPLSSLDFSKYEHLPKAVQKRIKKVGYVKRLKSFYIYEISICDRPKNTRATIVKGDTDDNILFLSPIFEDSKMDNLVEQEIIEKVKSESVIDVEKSDVHVIETSTEIFSTETTETIFVEPLVEETNVPVNIEVNYVDMTTFKDFAASVYEKLDLILSKLAEITNWQTALPVPLDKSDISKESDHSDLFDIIKSTIKTEFEVLKDLPLIEERKGHINGGEEPTKKPLDVTKMSKVDAYAAIAKTMAHQMKNV